MPITLDIWPSHWMLRIMSACASPNNSLLLSNTFLNRTAASAVHPWCQYMKARLFMILSISECLSPWLRFHFSNNPSSNSTPSFTHPCSPYIQTMLFTVTSVPGCSSPKKACDLLQHFLIELLCLLQLSFLSRYPSEVVHRRHCVQVPVSSPMFPYKASPPHSDSLVPDKVKQCCAVS